MALRENYEIPAEFYENYSTDLFLTAKIAKFTPDEKEKYTEDQKMIYDYQNCIDFAREQGYKTGYREKCERKS